MVNQSIEPSGHWVIGPLKSRRQKLEIRRQKEEARRKEEEGRRKRKKEEDRRWAVCSRQGAVGVFPPPTEFRSQKTEVRRKTEGVQQAGGRGWRMGAIQNPKSKI